MEIEGMLWCGDRLEVGSFRFGVGGNPPCSDQGFGSETEGPTTGRLLVPVSDGAAPTSDDALGRDFRESWRE